MQPQKNGVKKDLDKNNRNVALISVEAEDTNQILLQYRNIVPI
jgi:hypothetical protein